MPSWDCAVCNEPLEGKCPTLEAGGQIDKMFCSEECQEEYFMDKGLSFREQETGYNIV